MSWQNIWRLAKSDYLKLVPILALALSQELMRVGSATALSQPFYGGSDLAPVQTLELASTYSRVSSSS